MIPTYLVIVSFYMDKNKLMNTEGKWKLKKYTWTHTCMCWYLISKYTGGDV
jgi:hypothetical protein